MPNGNYFYENRYYENCMLFTGIKDGIEYKDGVVLFAKYTGESFYCDNIPISDYNTKYTIIEFTPDYSQDYYFNRSGSDTVIRIESNLSNLTTGNYDTDSEHHDTYLEGGRTYYIGVAAYSGDGTCSLEVGPYYYSGGSSSSSSSYY